MNRLHMRSSPPSIVILAAGAAVGLCLTACSDSQVVSDVPPPAPVAQASSSPPAPTSNTHAHGGTSSMDFAAMEIRPVFPIAATDPVIGNPDNPPSSFA